MSDVVLAPAEWSDQVARTLERATGLNSAYTVAELEQEVRAGATKLMAVVERRGADPVLLGYVCLWIEPQGQGTEMVLQAGAALTEEKAALDKAMPAIERVARDMGAGSIRVHVAHTARRRLMERQGFREAERVLRKGV